MVHAAVIALDTEERASLLALGPLRRAQQSESRKGEPENAECEFLFIHVDHLSLHHAPWSGGRREKLQYVCHFDPLRPGNIR
jgi:hypothetical protein